MALQLKSGIVNRKFKNSIGIIQDYFLFFPDNVWMMPAEIKIPAIIVRGEKGRAGVGGGTTTGGCVIAGEEPWVTIAFVSSRVVKEEFAVGEFVEV